MHKAPGFGPGVTVAQPTSDAVSILVESVSILVESVHMEIASSSDRHTYGLRCGVCIWVGLDLGFLFGLGSGILLMDGVGSTRRWC